MPALQDSIQTSQINLLQSKIDSLEKVSMSLQASVAKTEIGQSYFSDLLNSQLSVFSFIVAAIVGGLSLLTFGVVKSYMQREVKKVGKELTEFKDNVNESNKEMKKANATNQKQIYRSMFYISFFVKQYTSALLWNLRIFELNIANDVMDQEDIERTIEFIKMLLPDITYPKVDEKDFNEIKNLFHLIKADNSNIGEEQKKEIAGLEKEFLKNYFLTMPDNKITK